MSSTQNNWKAGLSRRIITPQEPMLMAGYAGRDKPFESVLHDLWAKAVALEDENGTRVVLVCIDLIGLTTKFCDEIGGRVQERWGVPRENLVFSASHTHSGPMLSGVIEVMLHGVEEEQKNLIQDYTRRLADTLTEIIGQALENLEPAHLNFGRGQAMFAVNRRTPTANGFANAYNPTGPSDFEVPVLQVSTPDGEPRAIICGYACHTTTLSGLQISGDWAGFAQLELEEKIPGVQAMVMLGCAADQNPLPRGEAIQAKTYGAQLCTAVLRALGQTLQPLNGPLQVQYETIELALQPHTRDEFEERLNSESNDIWTKRHAELMLQHYDAGAPIQKIEYPVQAISFGNDCVLLVLSGEVVVDYSLRAKRELNIENLIVIGYANGIAAYIPSLRVLREGGYEAGDSRIYFGLPTPFAEDVEERIFAAIERVTKF
jgi:hypothetical protein